MRLIDGKLLTADQSVRLALIDSTDRDELIASIARGLYVAEQRLGSGGNVDSVPNNPDGWYRILRQRVP